MYVGMRTKVFIPIEPVLFRPVTSSVRLRRAFEGQMAFLITSEAIVFFPLFLGELDVPLSNFRFAKVSENSKRLDC